jgi:hypothetical protein
MRPSGPYAIAVGCESPRANVSTRKPDGTVIPRGAPAAGTASVAPASTTATIVFLAVGIALSLLRVKGVRHFFRNFTALAVREHLRSQIEDAGDRAELTPKEVELVRFATERSDQLSELANKSPGK